jgi:MFS family permease
MQAVGARRWIALLMIRAGLVSAAFACTPMIAGALNGGEPTGAMNLRTLYVLRFLSGAVMAGIIPCIIIYLANWSTAAERTLRIGGFLIAIPLSAVIFPAILWASHLITGSAGGFGLKGWQWLFIVGAVPSVLVGLLTLYLLPDTLCDATWLDDEVRDSLQGKFDADVTLRKAPVGRAAANWLGPFLTLGLVPLLLVLLLPERWRAALRRQDGARRVKVCVLPPTMTRRKTAPAAVKGPELLRCGRARAGSIPPRAAPSFPWFWTMAPVPSEAIAAAADRPTAARGNR